MTHVLAVAQAAFLMSVIKPLLFAAVVIVWGRVATLLSKDAAFFYLKPEMWSGLFIGTFFLGLGLLLYIPIFWGGWILMIILAGLPLAGYTYYRNLKVPAESKWDLTIARVHRRIDRYQREKAQANASLILLTPD